MSDRAVIALALAASVGAHIPIPVPVVLPIVTVFIALIAQRQAFFIIATALLVSSLSYTAWRHLDAPVSHQIKGNALLLNDPRLIQHAVGVAVKLNGRHYELYVNGDNRQKIQQLQAGDSLAIIATSRPLSGPRAPSLRRQHMAAQLTVSSVGEATHHGRWSMANGFRNVIEHGAADMPSADRALFTGLIYGDDRNQTDESIQQFRDSGLAHLTAVSGENVAFVLLVFTPVFRRMGLVARFAGGLAVLVVFGMITRWQPSVVRAEIMAALMLFASFRGRKISLIRTTSLTVVISLLIDPMLVGSIGFLMSVFACVGMACMGEQVTNWFGRQHWLARILGYSIAAQVAVVPIELVVFRTFPFASVFANALADPVAGFVMAYGVVAGSIAGLGGHWLAPVVHVPTVLCLEWIRLVARLAAAAGHMAMLRWPILIAPGAYLFLSKLDKRDLARSDCSLREQP